jgi:hypothetical protein
LRPQPRTSFHHQPEAQHPKSSAIHKLPADYPIFAPKSGHSVAAQHRSLWAEAVIQAAFSLRCNKRLVLHSIIRRGASTRQAPRPL